MDSAAPIRCQLRPSALLTAFLFVGHGMGVISIIPTGLPAVAKLSLATMLGFSLFYSLWGVWRPGITSLIAEADGRMQIEAQYSGGFRDALVSEQTLVLSWLIVLRYKFAGERFSRSLVLLPDGLTGADTHRLLRRWLRWKSLSAMRGASPGSGPVSGA